MSFRDLDQKVDDFIDNEMIDDFLDIELDKDIDSKLLNYQYLHVFNLLTSIKTNNIIIDGSDTGTGKTYCAIALAKQLNLRPLIICPKSVINCWYKVCDYFNVRPLTIVNYETIKNGKMYTDKKLINRKDCPYFKIINDKFTWNLPKNSLLIFDEVHKCKNKKTTNGKLLLSIKKVQKALLLSATLADTIDSFHIYGYLLNYYNNIKRANSWIKSVMRESAKVNKLYKYIYPKFGSRMMIKDLGDKFPKNHISAFTGNLDPKVESEINTMFEYVDKKMKVLKTNKVGKDESSRVLAKITKVRMKIEKYKIPIFEELAKNGLSEGKSIIIFMNYLKNMFRLAELLNTKCLVNGLQTIAERNKNIEDFQSNKSKVIICIMKAGSQSINLHDIHGDNPRLTLISPSFSSIDLKQALGRAFRSEAKTNVQQKIIFTANNCK
jgi:superfamily II DNA or RNA helicase